jgi:A/G-specific adenine glycosylase
MLQQTTVAAVKPYFETFTRRWPNVAALAAADDAAVMAAWAGLGYYARARNLLACARTVAEAHGGVFPDSEASLRTLPGIGAYTAAAIAAIAFGRRMRDGFGARPFSGAPLGRRQRGHAA